MTDTLDTLRRLAPEAAALADLPWDIQLIDNTIDEVGRVQQEMVAAINPVLRMLAKALAALEPIAQALEKTSPDTLTTGRGYNMGDGEMARIVLPVGAARRAAGVLEKSKEVSQ